MAFPAPALTLPGQLNSQVSSSAAPKFLSSYGLSNRSPGRNKCKRRKNIKVRVSMAPEADAGEAPPSSQLIFGGEKQLSGPEKVFESLSAPARHGVCVVIVTGALAAGYAVGATTKSTRTAAFGGALALGVAGGANAYALNSTAPRIAAAALHNNVVKCDDPTSLNREDIDSLLHKYGVSKQDEAFNAELCNLYERKGVRAWLGTLNTAEVVASAPVAVAKRFQEEMKWKVLENRIVDLQNQQRTLSHFNSKEVERQVFDEMPHRDLVSKRGLISVHAENGFAEEVLRNRHKMQCSDGIWPLLGPAEFRAVSFRGASTPCMPKSAVKIACCTVQEIIEQVQFGPLAGCACTSFLSHQDCRGKQKTDISASFQILIVLLSGKSMLQWVSSFGFKQGALALSPTQCTNHARPTESSWLGQSR